MSKWTHGHPFKLAVQGKNLHALLKEKYAGLIPGIQFIKIDTEGYEPVVLQSLSSLIAHCKPFLKVEVYRKLDDAQRRVLYRSIAEHGYTIHKIADDGDYFGQVLTEDDLSKWRHFDIFCVPGR
jgi:hypothetical protein